jgi:hypothetical protein
MDAPHIATNADGAGSKTPPKGALIGTPAVECSWPRGPAVTMYGCWVCLLISQHAINLAARRRLDCLFELRMAVPPSGGRLAAAEVGSTGQPAAVGSRTCALRQLYAVAGSCNYVHAWPLMPAPHPLNQGSYVGSNQLSTEQKAPYPPTHPLQPPPQPFFFTLNTKGIHCLFIVALCAFHFFAHPR